MNFSTKSCFLSAFFLLLPLSIANAQSYCPVQSLLRGTEFIRRVVLNDLDNTSYRSRYGNFISKSATLQQGASATFELHPEGTVVGRYPFTSKLKENWAIYIDLDHNGFSLSDMVASGITTGTTPLRGSFTVPTNALVGNTRMRVVMSRDPKRTRPCDTVLYGEVEDYTVNVTAANGQLDVSFGNRGKVELDWFAPGSILTQLDGRTISLGYEIDTLGNRVNEGLTVIRLMQDGSLDHSFGENGKVYLADKASSRGISLTPSGKIVVAAQSNRVGWAIWRLNSDGSLDTSFGNNGMAYRPINREMFEARVQSDERILVLGVVEIGLTRYRAMIRFNADGSADNTFGSNGIVKIYSDFTVVSQSFAFQQRDGQQKLLFAIMVNNRRDQTALIRFNPNGSKDSTFGNNGVLFSDWLPNDNAVASIGNIAVASDGRIIITGGRQKSVLPNISEQCFAQLDSNGIIDRSFGENGKICYEASRIQYLGIQASSGKIVYISGWSEVPTRIFRLNSNGSIDKSFGEGGILTQGLSSIATHSCTGEINAVGQTLTVKGQKTVNSGYGSAVIIRYLL